MNVDSRDLSRRLTLAREAARDAGRLTMKYFSKRVAVERKADDSPVTIADREAEQLLRDRILKTFPEDGILGEEFGEQQGRSGIRWILDPIDGTKSFIAGVPLFGTLVGVESEGQGLIGVIELPALDQRVFAAVGRKAWWQIGDGSPVRATVSNTERLENGVFLTSETGTFADRGAASALEQLESAAWYSRTWGDCYGYFLVATGRAAVMVDAALSLWDAAALHPVLKEAGGTLTDWAGNDTFAAGDAIATNGHVFEEVLAVTRPFAR